MIESSFNDYENWLVIESESLNTVPVLITIESQEWYDLLKVVDDVIPIPAVTDEYGLVKNVTKLDITNKVHKS